MGNLPREFEEPQQPQGSQNRDTQVDLLIPVQSIEIVLPPGGGGWVTYLVNLKSLNSLRARKTEIPRLTC